MKYTFDIILLIIIAIMTIIGIRKGFVKALTDLLSTLIAALLSALLSTKISEFIFKQFVEQGIKDRMLEALEKHESEIVIKQMFEDFPNSFARFLESRGITETSLVNGVSGTKENISEKIIDILSPIVILIINFFVVIILFILFMLIIKALAKLLDKLFDVPFLNSINEILGGVFGFAMSLLVICLFLSAFNFVANISSYELVNVVYKAMDSSFLAKIISQMNPFYWIFG